MKHSQIYLIRACALWNELTRPWELLTDRQHTLRQRAARKVLGIIKQTSLESGMTIKERSNGSLCLA